MFCPNCRDEFRAGFTRCATCEVDLVDDLGAHPPAAPAAPSITGAGGAVRTRMVDYCGFFDLSEARKARDDARANTIRCEIVIRESPISQLDSTIEEEFWLRVEADRFKEASAILGFEADESDGEDGSFRCGSCGHQVAAEESFCSGCGARFEA